MRSLEGSEGDIQVHEYEQVTRLTKGLYDPLTGSNPLPSDELNQLGGFNVKGRETPSYVFQVRRPDNLFGNFPRLPLGSSFHVRNRKRGKKDKLLHFVLIATNAS